MVLYYPIIAYGTTQIIEEAWINSHWLFKGFITTILFWICMYFLIMVFNYIKENIIKDAQMRFITVIIFLFILMSVFLGLLFRDCL